MARYRRMRRMPPQEVVPSQRPSNVRAYRSTPASDMRQRTIYDGPQASGYTRPEPYVISTYDARPINCTDFVETYSTAEQSGADLRTFLFNVPDGRFAIIRRLDLRVYFTAAARDAVNGAPNELVTASFLIDGNAVPGANSFRVDDAICGPGAGFVFTNGLSVPLYFLAQPNSVVTLNISNTAGGNTFAFVAPILSGNLLMAQGINPTSEPGTSAALPIFAASLSARPHTIGPKRWG